MATNKIHFLATVLFPHVYEVGNESDFGERAAAEVIMNDSMRCWLGPREYGHFTLNPETGKVSWMTFPITDVNTWTEETLATVDKFSAGKPGKAVVDEATIPEEFWRHNVRNAQNKHFILHLVQDKSYDRFVRAVIDVSHRYEDRYWFGGEELTGAQVRGEGMERWSKGIITELDDQFYVRLAFKYFKATGIKAGEAWISNVMKYAILERYSPELAVKTIKFVSLSDKAAEIIKNEKFDDEVWPVSNAFADQYVEWLLEDILDAVLGLEEK